MSFPPPPLATVDWSKMGITVTEVHGHTECRYNGETGEWTKPEFIADPMLRVHGFSTALNYGQQVYEGMKAYRTPDNQINIFRPDFHAARIVHSSSFVSIPEIPKDVFIKNVELAVSKNAEFVPPHEVEALMYIRPLVFGIGPQVALSPPKDYLFCVFVTPGNSYHGVKPMDALILEDFDRAAPNGTGSAKVGGNYAPVMRWSDNARKEGYGITLHLDSKTQTEVDEFSTSGFIGIKSEGENHILVVPDSKSVIQSVTSDSCQQLAKSKGWKVEVRSIKYEELSSFSEVIAAGTAAALLPIKSITCKSKGEKCVYQNGGSVPGPCTVELTNSLKDIQKGKVTDQFDWCFKVKDV